MVRQPHREVHQRLVGWAEAHPPVPTQALADLMGPVRPLPVVPARRTWRTATQFGVGAKVFVVLTGLAVSGAAAAGLAHVAARPPEAPSRIVVPIEASTSPTPESHTGTPVTPGSTTSSAAGTTEPAPAPTSASAHPTTTPREAMPSSDPSTSDEAPGDDRTSSGTATATPTATTASPDTTDSTDPTDPSTDPAETPTPSATES